MKVRCVDNWMYEHILGRNKVYEVIRETSDNYIIRIDRVGYVAVSKYKFVIVEEDKMEAPILKKPLKKPNLNKIELKIGDKVILRDDIAICVEKPVPKDSEFEVKKTSIVGENKILYATIFNKNLNINLSIPAYLLIKVDKEKQIEKEEVRVVRKLKDLDGLENGMGLYIDSNLDVRVKNKNMLVCYGNDLINDLIEERKENYIEVLKSMGFKFEYKPLRTEEEIMNDLVEKEFKFGEGNFLLIKLENGKWDYMNNTSHRVPDKKYYTLESAKRVVKELNELLESEK